MPQDSSVPELRSHTLILGIGNPLYGDDGLGVRVAEILAKEKLPAGVVVEVAALDGVDLILRMEGWKRVILIDAVQMGKRPGTWHCFKPEEVRLIAEGQGFSLHEIGLASALELAQALGRLPQEVIIYGVEPQTLEVREGLSPSVQSAIPEIIQHILEELWKREK
ncbi:MAG: hydrogenase maturation protease [Anaerolineales bacterium]|nr:hydrogenase maturation protease [Anaerolineales bacterium]MCS7247333.1 hydrogenase maturation protease [Anaerolineales bacterium]MDW8161144.1 hydrogenase maturation protease [Anaerolineales bacterium]MDW8447296.1 hydrogenase maturation protease [Anaerolineales bacterium]